MNSKQRDAIAAYWVANIAIDPVLVPTSILSAEQITALEVVQAKFNDDTVEVNKTIDNNEYQLWAAAGLLRTSLRSSPTTPKVGSRKLSASRRFVCMTTRSCRWI